MNGPGLKTMDQTPQVLILHRLSLINTMTEHKKLIKDIPLPKENWNACNDPQHNVLKTMLSIPFDDATGVIYFLWFYSIDLEFDFRMCLHLFSWLIFFLKVTKNSCFTPISIQLIGLIEGAWRVSVMERERERERERECWYL